MEDKKKEKLFMRDFFRKAGKAIYDYELIEPGDRILVGVSGGKDSLALLEVLALRARDPKQNYTVCEQLGVEFIHRTIAIAVKEDSGKPVCFVCSWNRRKTLFGIAKEYGCNKLALGHHRDDAIESLLMSMMFNGTIASMPPKLAMFDRTFTLIRPFIYLTDEETTRYAAYRNFKKQKKNCPHERATNRHAVAEIIRQMEALSPHVKGNLFAAMKNMQSEYLP